MLLDRLLMPSRCWQILALLNHFLDSTFDRDRRLLEHLLEGDSHSLMFCLLGALHSKVRAGRAPLSPERGREGG